MDIWDKMAARWPSEIVARTEVGRFSGGLLNPRSLANLDALKQGPAGKIKMGQRKVAYPVQDLVAWLRARATTATTQGQG